MRGRGDKKAKLPQHVRMKRAKGRVYYYYDTGQKNDSGKPILKPLPSADDPAFGRTLATAQRLRTMRASTPDQLTVSGLINMFEKSPEFKRKAKKTQSVYHTYLKQIGEKLGIAPAAELDAEAVTIVRDKMEAHGAANQFVATVGALYKWGRTRRHVTNRPSQGIEKLEGGEYSPWPAWLLERALVDDDPIIRWSVGLLYYTAGRISEVTALQWPNYAEGAIALRAEKNDRSLHIPAHRGLKALLAEIPKGDMTILLDPRGRPWKPENLRRYIQAWAKELGLHVVAHGLRKNAVIALLEAGCSVAETASISGQTMQMVEHYAKDRNQKKLATAAILRWNKSGQGKRK